MLRQALARHRSPFTAWAPPHPRSTHRCNHPTSVTTKLHPRPPLRNHQQLGRRDHTATARHSLGQRVAPVLLKAEGLCIATAVCLQLASLYVLQSQVLTKYPTRPPPTTSPEAPTDTAEHLDTTAATAEASSLPNDTQTDPTTATTHEAVLQTISSTGTRPGEPSVTIQPLEASVAVLPGPPQFTDALVSTSWLGALQGLLLCTALFCNSLLRGRLQPAPAGGSSQAGTSSAVAGGQLVRLETTVKAQATQLAQLSKQVEKLQLRSRLTGAELKRPLQALQQQVAQHASVMGELAEGQAKLQKEAQDAQLLIAAVQGVSAKQFKVLADALQRVSSGSSGGKPAAAAARAGRPPPAPLKAGAAARGGTAAAASATTTPAAAQQNGAAAAAAAPQNGVAAAAQNGTSAGVTSRVAVPAAVPASPWDT